MTSEQGIVSRRSFIQGAALGMVGVTAVGAASAPVARASESASEPSWNYEADVVVIGSGGAGLPAALKALADGASVIVVEANWDCGGHAAVSGGNLHSGCGIKYQTEYGIEDSKDQYYLDHTNGELTVSRMNDRSYIHAIADSMVEAYDFILDKGVLVQEKAAEDKNSYLKGYTECDSVPRWTYADAATEGWASYFGKGEAGIGVTRPLERSARQEGVQFLMNYHMDKIFREAEGRVQGIQASYTPTILPGQTEPLTNLMPEGNIEDTSPTITIKANKGIVLATGGSTGNLVFRTAYDPRLGPEFDGLSGMPFSDQDASGEIAAMKVGAALGTMANYMQKGGHQISMASRAGCRYGYGSGYTRDSILWPLLVATGVSMDYESMIIVNMLGARCGNEDTANLGKYKDETYDYFDTALSSVVVDDPDVDGDVRRLGGPLWAIFDQATADRNDWDMEQGTVDYDNGYCFKADTLEELAGKVVNKYYEDIKMDPTTLAETVANYNAAVDAGEDPEWGRTTLVNKIESGPFYAAWCTPELHDCYGGLRVNPEMQVIDVEGSLIEGLFACGEVSSGQRAHGLGRVITSGYIAGRSAAAGGATGVAVAAPEGWDEMTAYATASVPSTSADGDKTKGELADGTFSGSSENGIGGQLSIDVTVEGGVITGIEITKSNETEGIGSVALPTLVDEAIDAQSADIESVSGATITSKAFCEALEKALEKARS